MVCHSILQIPQVCQIRNYKRIRNRNRILEFPDLGFPVFNSIPGMFNSFLRRDYFYEIVLYSGAFLNLQMENTIKSFVWIQRAANESPASDDPVQNMARTWHARLIVTQFAAQPCPQMAGRIICLEEPFWSPFHWEVYCTCSKFDLRGTRDCRSGVFFLKSDTFCMRKWGFEHTIFDKLVFLTVTFGNMQASVHFSRKQCTQNHEIVWQFLSNFRKWVISGM